MTIEHQKLVQLRKLIVERMSLDELENVTFDAGLVWENLSGSTLSTKAMSIVDYLRRYGLPTFTAFIGALDTHRPDLDLRPFGGPGPQEKAPAEAAAPRIEYENFNLVVQELGENRYLINARYELDGSAGTTAVQTFDSEDERFKKLFRYLEKLVADKQDAKALGAELYDFLFPREVHGLFSRLRGRLLDEGKGIRIRLELGSSALSRLPWEYCYDPENNLFLAKDGMSPMVRYVQRPYTPDSLSVGREMRVLLALAGPKDQPPVGIEAEEGLVREALAEIEGPVQLEVLKHSTIDELRQALLTFRPDVVHFVGHGSFQNGEGKLLFETEANLAHYVSADQLSDLFRNRGVKIVILNACNTAKIDEDAPAYMSVAQGLVYAAIPAVFAMQFKVPDALALRFTKTLYEQLLLGEPLDKAVTEMRIAASLGPKPEDQVLWGIPVLFMRSEDGRIWDQGAFLTGKSKAAEPEEPVIAAPDFSTQAPQTDLERQIVTFEKSLSRFYGQFDVGDREDMIDSIQEARELASKLPMNGRRIGRKLGEIADIIKETGVGTLLLATLERIILQARRGQ